MQSISLKRGKNAFSFLADCPQANHANKQKTQKKSNRKTGEQQLCLSESKIGFHRCQMVPNDEQTVNSIDNIDE